MKPIFYAYLITVLVLSGCSSGKSTFERGNYYEAVITSVNRLRKNNDHKKSVETLRQAYPLAVAFYEDRAKTSLSAAERFKWTEVVKSYSFINTMYDEIKRCPGALAVIPNPVNYFGKLQEARQNAAEEHYAAGILALQGKTRETAKQAYGYFKITNDYVPGYKEVNDYMKAALDAATVKIVVEPIPVHSRAVGVSAEFFNDKISEFVHAAPISEFVKFYTRAEAKKVKLNPDHIIQLEFDEFTVGQVYKHEKELQLTKDSVVMGTYITPTASGTQNQNNNTATNGTNRTGLVTSGTGVVASTGTPVNTTSPITSNTQNSTTENERAAKELAEKRMREQQEAEKALADKLQAEREAAERERAAREAAAAKAAEEKAIAERALADKALADKIKAEKDQAEKARLENELAERIKAEKERAAREQAEKERLAKEAEAKAAKEAADKAEADRILAEKARLEKEAAEKLKAEKEKAERELAEKERAAKEAADKALAAKEKADKEKAEKEKADREKAEKEKADKEKSTKAKLVDPSINSEDTLNVTDPVTICHIPPGNTLNTRTLRINRSALKAHLAHGDSEGTCDGDQKEDKGKSGGNPPGKPAEEMKTKPGNNKSKSTGASSKAANKTQSYSVLHHAEPVMIASANNDPDHFLRYLDLSTAEADTNKVYGTVKATLYHYTKTTTSKGIVSFRILDAKTGALLSAEKMPGEFVWKSEWATFNGDERALSAEQLKLSKQKELPAPASQDLFIEFTRPIYDQITTKIKDFYKGY